MPQDATNLFLDATEKLSEEKRTAEKHIRNLRTLEIEKQRAQVKRIEDLKLPEFLKSQEMEAARKMVIARGGTWKKVIYSSNPHTGQEEEALLAVQLSDTIQFESRCNGYTTSEDPMLLMCTGYISSGVEMFEIASNGRILNSHPTAFVEAVCAFHKIEPEEIIPLIRRKFVEIAEGITNSKNKTA